MRDTADKRAAAVLMQSLHSQNLMVADGQSHPKAVARRDRRSRVELPPSVIGLLPSVGSMPLVCALAEFYKVAVLRPSHRHYDLMRGLRPQVLHPATARAMAWQQSIGPARICTGRTLHLTRCSNPSLPLR